MTEPTHEDYLKMNAMSLNFWEDMAAQMLEQGITYSDLAKSTGLTVKRLRYAFSDRGTIHDMWLVARALGRELTINYTNTRDA